MMTDPVIKGLLPKVLHEHVAYMHGGSWLKLLEEPK